MLLLLIITMISSSSCYELNSTNHDIEAPIKSVHLLLDSQILVHTHTNEFFVVKGATTRFLPSTNIQGSVQPVDSAGQQLLSCTQQKSTMTCNLLIRESDGIFVAQKGSFRVDSPGVLYGMVTFLNAPHLCIAQSLRNIHSTFNLPMFSCRTLQTDGNANDESLFNFLHIPRFGNGLKLSESAVRPAGALPPSCSDYSQIDFIGQFSDQFNMYFLSVERQTTSPKPHAISISLYRMCKDELSLLRKLIRVPLEWHPMLEAKKVTEIRRENNDLLGFSIVTSNSQMCFYSMLDVNEVIYQTRKQCFKYGNTSRGLCILKADEQCHAVKGWNENLEDCNNCVPDQYDLPYPLGGKKPVPLRTCIDLEAGGFDDVIVFSFDELEMKVIVTLEVLDTLSRINLLYFTFNLDEIFQNSSITIDDKVNAKVLKSRKSIILVGRRKVYRIWLCKCADQRNQVECSGQLKCTWSSKVQRCLISSGSISDIMNRSPSVTATTSNAITHFKRDSRSRDNLIKKVLPAVIPVNGTRLIIDLWHPVLWPKHNLPNVMVDGKQCDKVQFIHRTRISCHSGTINMADNTTSNVAYVNLTIKDRSSGSYLKSKVHTWTLLATKPTVNDLTPKKCIASGGSTLSIFGNNLDIGWRASITIGTDTACSIISISSKLIKCRIEHTNMAIDQLSMGMFQDVQIIFDNNTRITMSSAIFVVPDPIIDEFKLSEGNGGYIVSIRGTYLDAVQNVAIRLGKNKPFLHCPSILRIQDGNRNTDLTEIRFSPLIPSECLAQDAKSSLNVTVHLDAHRVFHRFSSMERQHSPTFRTSPDKGKKFGQPSYTISKESNGSKLCLTTPSTNIRSIVWDCEECKIYSSDPICCHRGKGQSRKCSRTGVYVYLSKINPNIDNISVAYAIRHLSPAIVFAGSLIFSAFLFLMIALFTFNLLKPTKKIYTQDCECCECGGDIVMSSSCSSTVQPNGSDELVYCCSQCETYPQTTIIHLMDSLIAKQINGLSFEPQAHQFESLTFSTDMLTTVCDDFLNPSISLSYALAIRSDFHKNLEAMLAFLDKRHKLPDELITQIMLIEWLSNAYISQGECDLMELLNDILSWDGQGNTVYVRCGRNLFPVQIDQQTTFARLNLHLQNHIPNITSIKALRIDGTLQSLASSERTVISLLNEPTELFPIIMVNQKVSNYYHTLDGNSGCRETHQPDQFIILAVLLLTLGNDDIQQEEVIERLNSILKSVIGAIFNHMAKRKCRILNTYMFEISSDMIDTVKRYAGEFGNIPNASDRIIYFVNECRWSVLFPFKCFSNSSILTKFTQKWYNNAVNQIYRHSRTKNGKMCQDLVDRRVKR
ncbi:hypothetical protein ACOME3_001365 [Neoechinorhynchus agilis]